MAFVSQIQVVSEISIVMSHDDEIENPNLIK